jgi:uncharacterized protein YllA (UPF0747 family)
VVDTALQFSKSEIEKMIVEEPEKFSPNVILRPLYQEVILPNLAMQVARLKWCIGFSSKKYLITSRFPFRY